MKLTKRSTILLAVFFLGLVALAADRTILRPQGGPRAASASAPRTTERPPDNVPVKKKEPLESNVAERLNSLRSGKESDFEQVRDPFALPGTWLPTPDVPEQQVPDVVAHFIRTHKLTAIVVNGQVAHALVNDRFLIPGESLDGFTLISIENHSVVFRQQGHQAVLELIDK